MEINNYLHFSTGEFAKLCDTTKQTLYHYDNVGIFSPEIKDVNGYRYYSYQQIEVFGAISMLKEIGVSLLDIKSYLNKRSPSELAILLEEEREKVIKKINELNQIKSFIDRKISVTKDAICIDTDNIVTSYLDKEYFIITKVLGGSSDKEVYESFKKHMVNCSVYGINASHFVGSIVNLEDVILGEYSSYSYVYTKLSDDDISLSNYTRNSGEYVIAYHKGSYYTTDLTYKKIFNYIESNNLSIDSNFYEEVIFDDLSVKGYDNYMIKIYAKVSKKDR